MTVQIGSIIKKLRIEKKVTQEMLATSLGVTPQAISRWETCAVYPDIELLPALADYFSVSIDELLGYRLSERETVLAKIKKEAERLAQVGTVEERISHCRCALLRYPFDFDLKLHLAVALCHQYSDASEKNAPTEEIEALLLSIVEHCNDMDIRYSAIFTWCDLLGEAGRGQQAKELIDRYCTPMKYRKESVLANGIGDGKTELYKQDEIDKLTDALGLAIRNLVLDDELPNDPTTWEKKIQMLVISSQLYRMIYGDHLMFYHERLATNHYLLSTYLIAQGKTDSALEALERMAHHARAYDVSYQNDHGKHYTSVLVDRLIYPEPSRDFHEVSEHNAAFYMLDRLRHPRYDTLRTHHRFLAIVQSLEESKR